MFCSESAARHTTKALQIQGGYGFMKGSKVERFYREDL
ncbi:acyl-CoA dehydrogenase family protein [Syntrophomonas wolfei]|nr:acyl-CoA dehydrogenase family protein [Syntrophomonas wolfei]